MPVDCWRCGSAARVTSAAPITLVSNVRRHQSASASASAMSEMAPAEYTTSSRPPRPSTASSTTRWHCASSVTSHASPIAVPVAPLAASSQSSPRRAANATCAPAAHRVSPITRPIPDDAPTTSTRRPTSRSTWFMSLSSRVAGRRRLPRPRGATADLDNAEPGREGGPRPSSGREVSDACAAHRLTSVGEVPPLDGHPVQGSGVGSMPPGTSDAAVTWYTDEAASKNFGVVFVKLS